MGIDMALFIGGDLPADRNKRNFRNNRCSARDLSVTATVTGVTLKVLERCGGSPRRACHAFEACYACFGCAWQAG